MKEITDFFINLFKHGDWPARWNCGTWSNFHGWLYIISDLLIWSAYFTIPIVIIKYIFRKRETNFVKLYFLFACFILLCGATHFLDAASFWFPLYRLNALIRLLTGIISWVTVFYIIKYLPQAFTLRSQKALEQEIDQRKTIVLQLKRSEEQLQAIFKFAPDALVVIDNDGLIKKWNPASEKMFGWKESEVLNKLMETIIVPERLRSSHAAGMKRFIATGVGPFINNTVIQPALRKNLDEFDVELTVSSITMENEHLFMAFLRDVTERRKVEMSLKESEERYRLLTSEVKDYAIVMLSPEGIVISTNEGVHRIYGYNKEEIIGKHFSIFYSKNDNENNIPSQNLAVVALEGRQENEGWRIKKDGSLYCANNVMTALKRDGKIIGFSKITSDITERKNKEYDLKKQNIQLQEQVVESTVELHQSEYKYKNLFENTPLPMWVVDLPSLKFIDVNEAAVTKYGYNRDEFLNMTAKDICPEHEKSRVQLIEKAEKGSGKNKVLFQHLKKDNSVIEAEIISHGITVNNKHAIMVVSVDVTERNKVAERLDFALESGKIGIWEINFTNNTSVTSLLHDQIYGYNQPVKQWSIDILKTHIHPDDSIRVERSFKELLMIQKGIIETKIIWPDKSIHWILLSAKIIADVDSKPLKMFGTVLDITNIKKAEEEIGILNNELEERVQVRTRELFSANKELESFSYSVSHDLRAPLRAIYGYSQILVEDYNSSLDEEGNRLLNRVMFNAKKMGLLIDDLLAFSRLGKAALKKSELDLNIIVNDVIAELSQSSKYHHKIITGNLGNAFADKATLYLVFQNLLLNATKYSSKKDNPLVEVGVTETDKGHTYFIKDNGAGFDMTYYDKLFGVFQRFHRQDEFEGTGVGLAIVQKIILKHGGQIWAEAKVNEGACFYFTLQ